jgi:16S rRNA processing protein RimM
MGSSSSFAKDSDPAPAAGLITIGRVVGTHGLRGEVRVRLETDFPQRFDGLREAYLVRGGRTETITIGGTRPHRGGVLMVIHGIDDMAAARQLCGADIAVPREAAVRLGADEYYVFEIIGLRVRAVDGRLLGTVTQVMRTPANDVYVVEGPDGELLVPALRDVVRRVDRAGQEMTVALPPGLEPVRHAR